MNYIEFEKNTDWTIKIHYNRKLRIIKGKSNINKIFELCEKNGYRRINKNCYLEEHIDEIVKEYHNIKNPKGLEK